MIINKYNKIIILILITVFILPSCFFSESETDTDKEFLPAPKGFPPVPFPKTNPYSKAKAELGRKLFYEKLLSKNQDLASCSHCMKPENSFCDDTRISRGHNHEPEYRNTMTIVNAAYRKKLFWDGRGSMIEQPAYRSLYLPMILGADTNETAERLKNHPEYPALFKKAFGPDAEPSAFLVSQAIATFVRTLISGNSRYDQYINGDKEALSPSEIRGMDLFFSDRTKCSVCHSGFLFTDGQYHNTGVVSHYFDRGLYFITRDAKQQGLFLTPTLRNIEYTAPYMHEGELFTLEAVIEHYNTGGKLFGNKDTLMKALYLSEQEKKDLVAFLKSLTDSEFLNNPAFKKPD